MSLAKLTSLSTHTLSLLLERQRHQELVPSSTNPSQKSLHFDQITRNLRQLRAGTLELQEKDGNTEAVRLMKSQYARLRGMLGGEAEGVEGLESLEEPDVTLPEPVDRSKSVSPRPMSSSSREPKFAPYTDDPEAGPDYEEQEPSMMLQTQRRLMDEQDDHLDHLSTSINRQRDLSLQINTELDVHTGLLTELDQDLDHTQSRMSGARRRLERVAKGARENGSTVTIALLILVLLMLIIVFKT